MLAFRASASSSCLLPAKPFVDGPLVARAGAIPRCHWPAGVNHFHPGASSSCFASFTSPTPLLFNADSRFCLVGPAIDDHDPSTGAIITVSDTAVSSLVPSPTLPPAPRRAAAIRSRRISSSIQPHTHTKPPTALRQRQLRASWISAHSPRHSLAHVHVRSRTPPYLTSAVVSAAVPTACFPRILCHPERPPPRPSRPP